MLVFNPIITLMFIVFYVISMVLNISFYGVWYLLKSKRISCSDLEEMYETFCYTLWEIWNA